MKKGLWFGLLINLTHLQAYLDIYGLAGDDNEFKHSWEMDPADLNPLRMPRNIVNSICSAEYDLDDDI